MDFSYVFSTSGIIWAHFQQYFLGHVLSWAMAAQLAVGGLAFLLAHKAAKALRSWIGRLIDKCGSCEASREFDRRKYETFLKVADPFLSVLFLGIALCAAQYFKWSDEGLKVLLTLSLSVFLFRFLTTPKTNRFWMGILIAAIWLWAIHSLFHFEDAVITLLDSIGITIGQVHVSMLTILRAPLLLLILFVLSKNISSLAAHRIGPTSRNPSPAS